VVTFFESVVRDLSKDHARASAVTERHAHRRPIYLSAGFHRAKLGTVGCRVVRSAGLRDQAPSARVCSTKPVGGVALRAQSACVCGGLCHSAPGQASSEGCSAANCFAVAAITGTHAWQLPPDVCPA